MEVASNAIQYPLSADLPVYFCDSIMCRLCGCTGNNVSFILLKETSFLAKRIHYEAGVKIKDTDILPRTVCRGCVDKIDLIRHFRKHCKKTQKVLQEMYDEKYNRIELQTKDSQSSTVIADDKQQKVVVEYINNQLLENTSIQNVNDITSSHNYGIMYNDTNTINNVYLTVPNLVENTVIYRDKVLGQITKPRVQTFSKEELQQLSTKQTKDINDEELQAEDELELTDIIVKTETEVTVENTSRTTTENELQTVQTQSEDTAYLQDHFYVKVDEPANNSPLLYNLLTNKRPEPDFILPDQNFETFETEQDTEHTMVVEKTSQSNNDDDIDIIAEDNLDDESKLDTFIITKSTSAPEESVSEENPENEQNTRKDRSGRTFVSNSHKYVKKITDKEYLCTICNDKFRYPFRAELHVRRHTGELPFICKTCGRRYISGFSLLKHERTHTAGQYICEICGKTFHQSYAIKDHQRIHTDTKPAFKCNICSKEFFTKVNFESHKLIHAEKKHICEVCGKGFSLYTVMRRHQIRHKKDSIFKCNLCPQISKTKDEYTQHKKRHDKQGKFNCKPCSLWFWTLKGLHLHETIRHKSDISIEENTNTEPPNELLKNT